MSERNVIHENFNTKQRGVLTAPDTHMHTSLLPIMSIRPANKAVEHLTSSYHWYCKRKQKQSTLISSGTVREKGKEKKSLSQVVGIKDWAEFYGCIK